MQFWNAHYFAPNYVYAFPKRPNYSKLRNDWNRPKPQFLKTDILNWDRQLLWQRDLYWTIYLHYCHLTTAIMLVRNTVNIYHTTPKTHNVHCFVCVLGKPNLASIGLLNLYMSSYHTQQSFIQNTYMIVGECGLYSIRTNDSVRR